MHTILLGGEYRPLEPILSSLVLFLDIHALIPINKMETQKENTNISPNLVLPFYLSLNYPIHMGGTLLSLPSST